MKFKDFLPLEDASGFFHSYWGNNFLHSKKIASIFHIDNPSQLLTRILEQPRLRYPQIRVLCEGGALSPVLYTRSNEHGLNEEIIPEYVDYLARKPNTVKVENLASFLPEFKLWDEKLSKLFSSRITLNGYFSFGPSGRIPIHFDPHHIFAVQLYGGKNWELGSEQSQTYPHKAVTLFDETSDNSPCKLTLNAGEMLYLPPGRTHSVHTEDVSIHVAIGVHTPRCFQSISTLLDRVVGRHPELRADQPFSVNEEGLDFRELTKSEIQIICNLLLSSVKND